MAGMNEDRGGCPAQPGASPFPPQGPVGDATAAGVPGVGASLAQLLTLTEKKSSSLTSLLAESRGLKCACEEKTISLLMHHEVQ